MVKSFFHIKDRAKCVKFKSCPQCHILQVIHFQSLSVVGRSSEASKPCLNLLSVRADGSSLSSRFMVESFSNINVAKNVSNS